MEDKILDFVEYKEEKSIGLNMIPVNVVDKILQEAGYEREITGDETNGWQVDFWYYFTKDNDRICFAGSLWYGGFSLSR